MKYFKHTELARLYHVSEKSVRNWVQAAQDGKLKLHLHEENGRPYIANVTKNIAIIEDLVKKGKKYKNTRGAKALTPKKEFYELYTHKQILDIISNITVHHETPLQYGYMDGGADDWDRYTKRLHKEHGSNLLHCTTKLIDSTANYIDGIMADHPEVNVVDLGPGNAIPIRPTLERLLKQKRLGRYIGIDISKDMVSFADANIKQWFGERVQFEPHVRDISFERFNDLLADGFSHGGTANMVFLLGATLANFRAPEQVLQTINNSLGPDDVFLCAGYLDSPTARRYFDYRTSFTQKVPAQDGLILHLLNVDESLYDVEQIFDEKERARSISVKPKLDLSIRFDLPHGTRFIELRKGDPILLWRHRHYNLPALIKLFDKSGFEIVQATKSQDQDYYLLAAKIKTSGR
jgi:uncharacterized SAM-dependent methyltransferase